MSKILIALGGDGYFGFPEEELLCLREAFPAEEVLCVQPAALIEHIAEARAVLLWQFPKEVLARAERLQFVMYAADGLGPKRLYPELIASSVQVVNSRGARAQAMAEHAVGALLALSRRLPEARDAQTKRVWLKRALIEPPLPMTLSGKTAVVFGLGEIGGRIAKILSAGVGMRVVAVRNDASLSSPYVSATFHSSQRQQALSGAHAALLALPPTEETKGVLSTDELSVMSRGALVVNVGRGASLDEDALLQAIEAGQVRGAALDVFHEEPLPERSPLWDAREVLLTPHSAGVTPDLWRGINQIFIEALQCALDGRPLRNLVDKARGY